MAMSRKGYLKNLLCSTDSNLVVMCILTVHNFFFFVTFLYFTRHNTMCVYTATMSSSVVCMCPLSSTDVVLGEGLSRRLRCLSKQTTEGISQEQQRGGPQESSPTDSTSRVCHQRNWSTVHATEIQKSQTSLLWLRKLCKCSFNVPVYGVYYYNIIFIMHTLFTVCNGWPFNYHFLPSASFLLHKFFMWLNMRS